MAKHSPAPRRGGAAAVGVLVCAASFALFALICAAICYATRDPVAHLRVAALAALLASGAAAALFLSRRRKEDHPLLAVLPLSVFAAILLIGALIASRGKLALSVPMNLLCYLLTGALFAVLARLPGRAGRKQKRRYGR